MECSVATDDRREGELGEDSVAHPARSFGRFKRHSRPEPSSMVSMDGAKLGRSPILRRLKIIHEYNLRWLGICLWHIVDNVLHARRHAVEGSFGWSRMVQRNSTPTTQRRGDTPDQPRHRVVGSTRTVASNHQWDSLIKLNLFITASRLIFKSHKVTFDSRRAYINYTFRCVQYTASSSLESTRPRS